MHILLNLVQIATIILFILALKGLSSAKSATRGNFLGIIAISILIIVSLIYGMKLFLSSDGEGLHYKVTLFALFLGGTIGYYVAKKIDMTALPQLVAAFHSLVGLAAVFLSLAIFCAPNFFINCKNSILPILNAVELSIGAAIGAITFSGSLIAFGKLQNLTSCKTLKFRFQNHINLLFGVLILIAIILFVRNQNTATFIYIILASLAIGYLLIIPIGGADMPVIVSMLNSYSGWTAASIGFTLENNVLIVVGALVGTSGAILSKIMCNGMNRSILNVIFGGIGSNIPIQNKNIVLQHNIKTCSPEDAAFIIKNANSLIIVPGYGMAVAQAQHAIKAIADIAKTLDINVKYAIHPVAGRMPGHMNVLLAEANIPYEEVLEIDDINHNFANTDVALIVGANDITNTSAKTDPSSPIYGMPILDVGKAKTVLFIKRSMAPGYAGIENPLFFKANTMMVLGDARIVCESILKNIK